MSEDKVRKQAFLLLDDIISNEKYSNLTLKKGLDGFQERDKAFISALVYGTLDKLISIDYVISLYATGRIQPKIKNILRMGIFQIMYMDRIPDSAAVNTSVLLAESIGKGMLKNYINGVLRTVSRNKNSIPYSEYFAQMISQKYSFPEFLVQEFIRDFGKEETEKFCSFENDRRTCIRVDKSKCNFEQLKKELNGEDPNYFDDCFYITGEPKIFDKEGVFVQSESSMAACRALSPENGERILDACAAPGGKTVYIASMIENGEIVACDKHEHRVELIKKNSVRAGQESKIVPTVADMTAESDLGLFDKILVDAPCSGLGVVHKKPEIKNTVTQKGLKELQAIQLEILTNCSKMLKKGGILVYSTCTVRNAENIDIVNKFLKKNTDFELDSLNGFFGEKFEKRRKLSDGYIQLYPHKDKTDGFFIARMKKN